MCDISGAVLTDEQKQIRFRKLLSKRKRAEASEETAQATPGPSNVPSLPTVPAVPNLPTVPIVQNVSTSSPLHEVVTLKRIPQR